MNKDYLFTFAISFLLSVLLAWFVRKLALRLKVLDVPDNGRKLHKASTPLLGGVAIFVSFWIVAGYLINKSVLGLDIIAGKLFWVFISSCILVVVGIFDDVKKVSAVARLGITAVAVVITIVGGVSLSKVTNPFGGIINLSALLSGAFIFLWLMGMIFTTKILDGLDGLSTGVAGIGAVVIFFLTNTALYFQPNVGLLALVFSACCLGFLVLNFYPAKIFLGESGGLFIGFMLGILAVISGGKVATALIVMAIPLFDLARVALVRIRKKQSIFKGDREHIHFKLVDSGLSQPVVVLLFYLISFVFGVTALFLQSKEKLLALIILLVILAALVYFTGRKTAKITVS